MDCPLGVAHRREESLSGDLCRVLGLDVPVSRASPAQHETEARLDTTCPTPQT